MNHICCRLNDDDILLFVYKYFIFKVSPSHFFLVKIMATSTKNIDAIILVVIMAKVAGVIAFVYYCLYLPSLEGNAMQPDATEI